MVKIIWGRSIGWNLDFKSLKKEGMEYSIIRNGADCYPWHEIFVWFPWVTTINGKRIWWQKVYKRKVWVVWGTGFHMEPEVQYATAFDLLTYDDKDTFTK
jgi:hypothetical protein